MSKIKIGNIKGPKGDRGEQGAVGPKGEQGIQGPVGPAGGVNSVNGMTGNVAGIATHTEVEQAVTGENLLNGTNLLGVLPTSGLRSYSDWRHADGETAIATPITITDAPNPTIKTGWKIVNPSRYGGIAQNNIPMIVGKTYTMSCYARGIGDLAFMYGSGNYYPSMHFILNNSTTWEKRSFSFVVDSRAVYSSNFMNVYFEVGSSPDGIEICGMKLEPGNTTDFIYTESPTDKLFAALDPIPEAHRNNYRGRNLGESTQMSAEHKAAIAGGSFRGLWVGDYWTHGGFNYRIADADYFRNCGDKAFTTHHLVIVPDMGLYTAAMSSSNTTDGGYVNSEMRTKNLTQAREMAEEAFPGMVLSHRDYFVNKVTGGKPSGGEWADSDVDLMNEIMLYGTHVFAPDANGTTIPDKYTTGNSQLALFRLNPQFIKTRKNHWLRDVVSAAAFALVGSGGIASSDNASTSLLVRPEFCIGVQAAGDEEEEDMEVVSSVGNPERMEVDEMDDSDLDMSTMGDPLDTTY